MRTPFIKTNGHIRKAYPLNHFFVPYRIIERTFDQGKIVGVLMIDFRKAFDSIDHSMLFRKMKDIGIEGKLLTWMKNYTEDRTQFVEVNSVRNVDYGMPQGSMFGPRLFSIYVNDLLKYSRTGEINMYADDATAHVVGNSVDEAVQKLNDVAKQIPSCTCEEKQSYDPEVDLAKNLTGAISEIELLKTTPS